MALWMETRWAHEPRGRRRRALLLLTALAGAGWAGPGWAQAVSGEVAAAPVVAPAGAVRATPQVSSDALKGLIPDAAVTDPAAWARTPAPVAAPEVPADAAAPLNPGSPLPDVAGFTLPWPDAHLDLPALPEVAADAGAPETPATAAGREDEIPALLAIPTLPKRGAGDHQDRLAAGRVVIGWTGSAGGIPERAVLEARFRQLSAIENLPGKSQ